jgi:hypothetical protein
MMGLGGGVVVACSFSSDAVKPRSGEEEGEVEKEADDESKDDRGLFCCCNWGSPIEEDADMGG